MHSSAARSGDRAGSVSWLDDALAMSLQCVFGVRRNLRIDYLSDPNSVRRSPHRRMIASTSS